MTITLNRPSTRRTVTELVADVRPLLLPAPHDLTRVSDEVLYQRLDQFDTWDELRQITRGACDYMRAFDDATTAMWGSGDPDDAWNSVAAIENELAARA